MAEKIFCPVRWNNGVVEWINQRKLPWKEETRSTRSVEVLARAIEMLEIRGAPAIGVAAGLGIAMAAYGPGDQQQLRRRALAAARRLRRTRPTAINLFWAIGRMERRIGELSRSCANAWDFRDGLVSEALAIQNEDIRANVLIGRNGGRLIRNGDVVLTHCNSGALATAGYGTAYGVIKAAWDAGKRIRVIATQTAPLYQGARLTMWELRRDGIPATLITDSTAAYAMQEAGVTKVVVGADRILRDGRVANKVGTRGLAIIARHSRIPFYVAAPSSTIDMESSDIPIEMRNPGEVTNIAGRVRITVPGARALNPAFDITPPELVGAIITENGIAKRPYGKSIPLVAGGHGGVPH